MDSIKGAQVLRDRIGDNPTPPPSPNPRVPDAALPIFHWLGVKPSSATGLPSTARAV